MKWELGFFEESIESSHPVRGAWIEIELAGNYGAATASHPVRGAWIEIELTKEIFKKGNGRTP